MRRTRSMFVVGDLVTYTESIGMKTLSGQTYICQVIAVGAKSSTIQILSSDRQRGKSDRQRGKILDLKNSVLSRFKPKSL